MANVGRRWPPIVGQCWPVTYTVKMLLNNVNLVPSTTHLVCVCNVAVHNFSINCQQDSEIEIDRSRTKRHRLHQIIKEQRPATRIIHQTRVREQLSNFVENERLLRYTVTRTGDGLQHQCRRLINDNKLPTMI